MREARASVHPRRRGEHSKLPHWGDGKNGSSPQARGTHHRCRNEIWRTRFIPAGAGNTAKPRSISNITTVHPRRRGEHPITHCWRKRTHGSSPQARGTHDADHETVCIRRFIPAGAGNTSSIELTENACAVHPRRRGEHTYCRFNSSPPPGSSPQARGTPATHIALVERGRFIPAGAGNTMSTPPTCGARAVHPRRRGEHGSAMS